ncbi:hypothetical protein AgCh_014771 [Apium graveolens]
MIREGLKYAIEVEYHRSGKVATLNKYDPITDIRALLSAEQLNEFSNSCFRKFLNIPHFKFQNQLIHNILIRQLKQPNPNELWIGVGGVILKFRQWKSDVDAVKAVKVYLLHHFLLTTNADTQIPKGDFDLLDCDQFDDYPWGKEVFKFTLDCLRNNAHTTSKENYYRLNGFPYALQIWFYECCPYMNGKYCDLNGASIPRVLNWTCDYNATDKDMYRTLCMYAMDVEIKKFIPSAEEVNELQLNELLVIDSNLDVRCNAPTTVFGDDDFVSTVPPSIRELSKLRDFWLSKFVVDNNDPDIEKNDAHDNSCMFPVNIGVDIAVDNDAKIGLEIKYNDEGKIGAEIGVDVEGKTRVEIRVDDQVPEDALGNVLADFSTGGVQKGVLYESGQFIYDDFSPNTMEKIESVINKIEQDSKVPAIVLEVEVVAKDGEVGEKVLIMETVDDSNFQVDCEVGEVYLPSEKTDSVKNASKMVNDIDMKDAGVYKSKVVQLRSSGETGNSVLGEITPALPKRKVKLPASLCSPFLRHFGSSSKQTMEPKDVDSLKGISPLDDTIGILPHMELTINFYNWLDKGLLLTNT